MRLQPVVLTSAVILLPLLSACVSAETMLARDDKPLSTAGYVAGRFNVNQGYYIGYNGGVGLGIVNTGSGEEYVMPFLNEDQEHALVRGGGTAGGVGLIKVAPGKYKIAYWVTYGTNISHSILTKKDIADSQGALSFTVSPGSVAFVGGWSVSVSGAVSQAVGGQFTWNLSREAIAAQAARAAFLQPK